ncbi:MAG TPA: carbonic anhydrase family protein [Usitatibacter sp.]|nr:carbonic anhydrase family protein [Usitatibacter sp.]
MKQRTSTPTVSPVKIAVLAWTCAFASATLAAETHEAGESHHWSYSGASAPQNWGTLDPGFRACSTGKNQSPIDMKSSIKGEHKPVDLAYKSGAAEIVNNGHTIQVDYKPGSSLKIDGHAYELKQFHFHAPSENTIDGKHFPMEVHLVHQDKDGHLLVVAVMFNEGAPNPLLASLWKQMPNKEGEKNAVADALNAIDLLPAQREYYRFTGSLTTPPCSEGVTWLVSRQPVTASKEQVAAFSKAVGFANNRPVQPLNGRQVVAQ